MGRVTSRTWDASNTTAICTSQNVAPANNFVIDGSFAQNGEITFDSYSRNISFYSADDLSAITFSITGYVDGVSTTESINAGPNNSTIYSANYYSSIQSIENTSLLYDATNISVGTGNAGYLNWVAMDYQSTVANVGVGVDVTGTITYSFAVIYNDVNIGGTGSLFYPYDTMTNATTDQIISCTVPNRYFTIFISDGTGTLTAYFLQQGIR